MPKLSDFHPDEITVEKETPKKSLRLSDFNPEEIQTEDSDDGSIMRDIGDFAINVGQGATLNAGDEIVSGLQAAKDVTFGDSPLSDFMKKYREHENVNQASLDEISERSPNLALAGQLAGGFAVPGGAIGLAGKGASMGAKMAIGAGTGATAGLFGSHENIDNPTELAKDVALGAGIGAAAEPVMAATKYAGTKTKEVLTPAINKLKGMGTDFAPVRQFETAVNEGLHGRGFVGDKAKGRLQGTLEGNAEQLSGQLQTARTKISGEYGKVLKDQVINDVDDVTRKTLGKAKDVLEASNKTLGAGHEDVLSILNDVIGKKPVSADKLKYLQKYLRDNASDLNPGELNAVVVKRTLSEASKAANDTLKSKVPNYAKVNSDFKDVEDVVDSFVKNMPADDMSIASGANRNTLDTQLFKASKGAIAKSELPFLMGEEQFNQLRLLKQGLQKLETKNPEVVQAMLKDSGSNTIEEMFKNIRSQADLQAVKRTIQTAGSLSKDPVSLLSLNSGLAGSFFLGNTAARVTSAPIRIGKKIFQATDDTLHTVADQLSQNQGTSHIGASLKQALTDKNSAMKNAAIFTIMQNPKTRQMLNLDTEENSSHIEE